MKIITSSKYFQNEIYPFSLLLTFFLSFGFGSLIINIILSLIIVYLVLNISSIEIDILDKVLIIFGIYLAINSFLNTNYYLSNILFTKFLFLTLSMKVILRKISENYLKKFFQICTFFLIFLIFDIFYQKTFEVDIFGVALPELGGRLSGPFEKLIPGTIILYLGFYFFLYFYLNFLDGDSIVKKITSLVILCIFAVSILITGERMNFISLFLGIFLIIFFIDKKKLHLTFTVISFLLCVVVITNDKNLFSRYESFFLLLKPELNNKYFNQKEIDVYKQEKNISNINTQVKLSFLDTTWGAHYSSAFQLFKDKPLFGNGIKSFRDLCKDAEIKSFRKDMRCSTHPHNIHLELLSETGLVGYFIFLTLIIFVFLDGIKMIDKKKYYNNKKTLFILFIASFILCMTLLFPIKSSGRLSSTFFGSIFWLNFSILYSSIYIMKRNQNKNIKNP